MSQRTSDDAYDPDADGDYETNPDERGKWISALIALLGAWLIVEAVIFDLAATQFWNDVLVGALLLAAGAYNYYRRTNERHADAGAATLAALLGLWLVAAPFVLGVDAGAAETANDLAFWNDVVVGLLAFVLGVYSAYTGLSRRRAARRAAS